MNAIIGLCHFCEAHGPQPLFCTFTTDNESHTIEPSKYPVQCSGCTSLGPDTVLTSKDGSNTIYCSRETVPNSDVNAFLRQAATRSITCEVSYSKEGGIVYFSETQGHVLSYIFKLQDTRARGLKRWFSIVVLMKDQMLLLSITQMLTEHMQKISTELQQLAEEVFNEEQKVCSQRALRLKSGRNDFGQSRSLSQLTGDINIFRRLHSHFTWMLKAGALSYEETLYTSKDLLSKLNLNETRSKFSDPSACDPPEQCLSIRGLENLLSKSVFRTLLYCTLLGIEITIKCKNIDSTLISKSLGRLVPFKGENNLAPKNQGKYKQEPCILEETENSNYDCKWSGTIPNKVPTIMTRIENAMSNGKLNDEVLHQYIKSIQMEWLGIARTVKSAIAASGPKSKAVSNLKKVLGISLADESLIDYWILNELAK